MLVHRITARGLLARLFVLAAGVLAVLGLADPALAHTGGGTAASNYDGRVTSVTPAMPGVEVRVLAFGDEFELVNRGSTEVLVPGYSGEPYLRIGPDGVWRNRNSPATYINEDRYADVELPARASARVAPEWEQVSTEPAYAWHDHRILFMGESVLPPMVAADPDRAHTVFEWAVPLVHGDTEVIVRGVLTWEPPLPPWTGWPAYAAITLVAVASGLLARGPRPLGAAGRRRRGRALARGGDAGAAGEPGHARGSDRRSDAAGTDHRGGGRGRLARVAPRPWRNDGADRRHGGLASAASGTAPHRRTVAGQRAVPRPGLGGADRRRSAGAPRAGLVAGGLAAVRRFREPQAATPSDD